MEFVYDDGGRSKYFKAERVGDCVTRAIAIATGKDYKEVYNELNKLSKECKSKGTSRNGHDKKVVKKYMEKIGWKWTPLMKIGTGCKVHLKEDELPGGVIICSLSKHIVCIKDGVIHDTYDCSRDETRCVYGYWKKA